MFAHANNLKRIVLSFVFLGITWFLASNVITVPFSGDNPIFYANLLTGSTLHPPGYIWNSLAAWLGKGLNPAPLIIVIQCSAALLCLWSLSQTLKIIETPFVFQLIWPVFWLSSFGIFRYFLIFEARALTLGFIAMFIWSLCKYLQAPSRTHKMILFITYLVACPQHHLMYVLLGPPLLVGLFHQQRGLIKSVVTVMLLSLVSPLPYLLLPLLTKSHALNILSWGDTHNLTGLFTHWSRSEFGIFTLARLESTQLGWDLWEHINSSSWYFLKATLATLFFLLFPQKTKLTAFEKALWTGIASYFFVIFFLGSIDRGDSWYGAILLRFWILPTPMLFLLIALKIQKGLPGKYEGSLMLTVLLLINFIIFVPSEIALSQSKIFSLHSHIMANDTPKESLIIHTSWTEWIRTILSFPPEPSSKLNPLSFENPKNHTSHLNIKSLFQKGWPREQLKASLRQRGYPFPVEEDNFGDRVIELLSDKSGLIILVGPEDAKTLELYEGLIAHSTEALGPMFYVINKAYLENKPQLISKAQDQCFQLFTEYEQQPLDAWIEPMTNYFCYPCSLTFALLKLNIKDSWKKICPAP